MNVQNAYDLWSASYDADHNLTRDLDRTVTAATLGELHCRFVLEIGCGTGKNTPLVGPGGQLFISELHPFKQYQGSQVRFQQDGQTTLIPAFVHHISGFLVAAEQNSLALVALNEWWHEADDGKPPRLITFLFQK